MTNPTVPDSYKKEIKKPVRLKKHVIVGTSSIIFPGVTLEEGMLGALSVVTKTSGAFWSIYHDPIQRKK
ncbi:MAG: hypothetical protein U5M23_13455 [Marinagarivorans sp.]|nr:hypothetical protein [Marinagarivorans sp.]